jgi:hypothetical protein
MNYPAFPNPNETSGMSMREYYASQCIGAIIQQCASDLQFYKGAMTAEEYFADKAFKIADAMIARVHEQNV